MGAPRFRVVFFDKNHYPRSREHFLIPSPHRHTHPFGGSGLTHPFRPPPPSLLTRRCQPTLHSPPTLHTLRSLPRRRRPTPQHRPIPHARPTLPVPPPHQIPLESGNRMSGRIGLTKLTMRLLCAAVGNTLSVSACIADQTDTLGRASIGEVIRFLHKVRNLRTNPDKPTSPGIRLTYSLTMVKQSEKLGGGQATTTLVFDKHILAVRIQGLSNS